MERSFSTEQEPVTLSITGMDCPDCALNLERGVSRLDGVSGCEVNFNTARMRVSGTADHQAVVNRVRALGYDVAANFDESGVAQAADYRGLTGLLSFLLSRRDTTLALIGGTLLVISLLFHAANNLEPVITLLHLLVVLIAGLPIMRSGWRELRYSHSLTINLLMSIAVIGALFIGETGEAATVIVLFAIGEALEGYTAAKARHSLRALLDLVPQEATVLQACIDCETHLGQEGYDGGPCPFCSVHETSVPVGDLQVGDTILIKPGERIPMDGVILRGTTAVNQAPITGESVPVDKGVQDKVYAGSINGAGSLEVEVSHLAADNTLNRIIHLVQEAQAQRAPSQRIIDRFAQWYTPSVVVVALLVAIIPPLLFNLPFLNPGDGTQGWLYRGLALLIIACPCALVISTPVAIVSALNNAARKGILIKGGAPLEALARIRVFAFDKTGTLTRGRPELVTCQAVNCQTGTPDLACDPCTDLLALAAAVERRSEHPVAHAIVTAARDRSLLQRYPAAQDVTSLTGKGVRGTINNRLVTIGTHTFFDTQYPHSQALCDEVRSLEQRGQTAMLLDDGDSVRGVLTVADQPRESSREMLTGLKSIRPDIKTVMLTGDNVTVAKAIARHLGLDDVRAELLPEDKLHAVKSLEAEYGATAMVGDGINDAPALAAAAVGIAMGHGGAAQAMETADVVLMQDTLHRLPDAVRISQRTRKRIRENVLLSLGLKALVLLLAVLGIANLWLAVFADTGTSLIVTLNGMRMLRD